MRGLDRVLSKVYFDYNATAPLSDEVLSALPEIAQVWGNPSSVHWAGRGPKSVLREARRYVSKALGEVSPLEIIFTSGGTEANVTVIRGVYEKCLLAKSIQEPLFGRNEFITTQVEHPSVLKSFAWIEEKTQRGEEGFKVHYIPVNRSGDLDMEKFSQVLSQKTALVSVMMANNETGTIFPIQKLAKMSHEVGAYFHTDGVQALGKISFSLPKLDVDYASFSAHKIGGLKGTGVLYARKGSPIEPLMGGSQERHRRGGTENVLGIWAMGEVVQSFFQESHYEKLLHLRNHFDFRIKSEIPQVSITAEGSARLPNTSNIVIPQVDGEVLMMNLDLLGYAVSTGAACSSGSQEPSPVLTSMGLTRCEAQSSLRVSFGWKTTLNEIDRFINSLKEVVNRLRELGDSSSKVEFYDEF